MNANSNEDFAVLPELPATLQLSVEQYSRTPSAWMLLLGLATCPWQDSSALDAFAFC
jgi:hypothetical protein